MNHLRFRDASHASVTDTLLAGLCNTEHVDTHKVVELACHLDEEDVPLNNGAKEHIARKFTRFFGS